MAERDNKGRFQAGNRAGKGNPYIQRVAALRKALYECVTPEDMRALIDVLKKKALDGDVKAITLLLDRLLGPSVALDVWERLEKLEKLAEKIENASENEST